MKKRKSIFPPVESADEYGLVAIGGYYSLSILLEAYYLGIFPWPISSKIDSVTWFSPDPRGLIKLSDLKAPKKFKKES